MRRASDCFVLCFFGGFFLGEQFRISVGADTDRPTGPRNPNPRTRGGSCCGAGCAGETQGAHFIILFSSLLVLCYLAEYHLMRDLQSPQSQPGPCLPLSQGRIYTKPPVVFTQRLGAYMYYLEPSHSFLFKANMEKSCRVQGLDAGVGSSPASEVYIASSSTSKAR